MQLSFPDVIATLNQLVAASTSDIQRFSLFEALDALQLRHSLEATLERHSREHGDVRRGFQPFAGPDAPWTALEDTQLRSEFELGLTLDAIAANHGRPALEVAARLSKPLGILTTQAVAEIRAARSRIKLSKDEVIAAVLSVEVAPLVVRETKPDASVAGNESLVTAPAPATPFTSAPLPAPTPIPIPSLDAISNPVVVDKPVDEAARPALASESFAPRALAKEPLPGPTEAPPQKPAHTAPDGAHNPELTSAEEAAVGTVLKKYVLKGAPHAALRAYIESEKFASKIRPEVLVWLRAELLRLA